MTLIELAEKAKQSIWLIIFVWTRCQVSVYSTTNPLVVILGKEISSGDMKFIAGEGMPVLDENTGAKGNLIIKFKVGVPEVEALPAGKPTEVQDNTSSPGTPLSGPGNTEAYRLKDFSFTEQIQDDQDTVECEAIPRPLEKKDGAQDEESDDSD